MKNWRLGLVMLSILSGAPGCSFISPAKPATVIPGLVNTRAAETLRSIHDQVTSIQAATSTSIPDLASATSQTALKPSNTPAPILSPTPIPSLTPLYPTETQSLLATETDQTSTTPDSSIPCNIAQFIEDVTIPDGFNIPVGLPFTKVWRIKNTGSCTWDKSYEVVYISGDRLKGIATHLAKSVKPNEIIDIPVNMITPLAEGVYKGNWMLQIGQTTFGSGSGGSRPFFVQIQATPNLQNIVYNFAVNFCAARWESNAGDQVCPGKAGDSNGFMVMLHKAELETRRENEPTLWMQPFNEKAGWITATYPAIDIKNGYYFQAEVGCLAGYEKCNVNFELWYRLPNAPKKKLGTWQEYHDNHLTRINIDLSPLAGQKASIILLVIANSNPDQAAAFWLMPQIRIP